MDNDPFFLRVKLPEAFPLSGKRLRDPLTTKPVYDPGHYLPGRPCFATSRDSPMDVRRVTGRTGNFDRKARIHNLSEALRSPFMVDEGAVHLHPGSRREYNLRSLNGRGIAPVQGSYERNTLQQLLRDIGFDADDPFYFPGKNGAP